MFAIIEDGGRQYKVQPGQELAIDLREGAEENAEIVFDRVLLANGGGDSVVGLPLIEGATVAATVASPLTKGPKLEIQKFRRRKNSRRHTGHRQKYTTVTIGEFKIPGLQVVETKQEEAPAESADAGSEEKAAE
ncbi:MAG: 50S ribosomal protein L21 [Rubinisphaera brasiliensis]|uniref:Large ribosomal subunit protein bL21 n=1 Tax=Rubinisphaera brasiliensis (strain ATCC 49424 / DSM 5305 / JCM 21570 / IAM 15109 / NBRC 103401 / IFAM 1448) TaxID=756272 RepID=F0SGM3_RUBBR|nr:MULTISPECIES: 50S ribosomal protein L21 [Rubinisphaera]ADY61628.1 LSU ribosomal protein L21P [Rubinisphaera brasiliensis DSM 5305]MBB01477.1 50S ribosomal protein L21 [Planctomyces sp.]